MAPEVPILKIRYRDAGKPIQRLYAIGPGTLPLPPHWQYTASPSSSVLMALSPDFRTLAAYDSRTFRPLWAHTFGGNGRRLNLSLPTFTPGGTRVILQWVGPTSDKEDIVLDVRSGHVVARLPATGGQFEDDGHIIVPAYDGVPNPALLPTSDLRKDEASARPHTSRSGERNRHGGKVSRR